MRKRRDYPTAFTLIELVLMLLVIAVISGMVAPRLMGFATGRKIIDCAGDVEAMARFARAQAIVDSRVYRLNLDTDAGTYWVSLEDGPDGQKTATPLETAMGAVHQLPDKVTIRYTDANATPGTVIHFFPTGRCDAGTIELADAAGTTVKIECPFETDAYRIVPNKGGK